MSRELESKLHNRVIALYDEMSEVGENQYADLVAMAITSMGQVVADIDYRNRQETWVYPVSRDEMRVAVDLIDRYLDDNPNAKAAIGDRVTDILWQSMELFKRVVTYGVDENPKPLIDETEDLT